MQSTQPVEESLLLEVANRPTGGYGTPSNTTRILDPAALPHIVDSIVEQSARLPWSGPRLGPTADSRGSSLAVRRRRNDPAEHLQTSRFVNALVAEALLPPRRWGEGKGSLRAKEAIRFVTADPYKLDGGGVRSTGSSPRSGKTMASPTCM